MKKILIILSLFLIIFSFNVFANNGMGGVLYSNFYNSYLGNPALFSYMNNFSILDLNLITNLQTLELLQLLTQYNFNFENAINDSNFMDSLLNKALFIGTDNLINLGFVSNGFAIGLIDNISVEAQTYQGNQ